MRIALISDTHLAQHAPDFAANAKAALAWIDVMAPDAVIHLGDVTVDGAFHPEEMDFAREVFTGRAVHWLPGNHDIGNPPCVPQSPSESVFSAAALNHFRKTLGEDHWAIEADGWQIVGLNTQLFGLDEKKGRNSAGSNARSPVRARSSVSCCTNRSSGTVRPTRKSISAICRWRHGGG